MLLVLDKFSRIVLDWIGLDWEGCSNKLMLSTRTFAHLHTLAASGTPKRIGQRDYETRTDSRACGVRNRSWANKNVKDLTFFFLCPPHETRRSSPRPHQDTTTRENAARAFSPRNDCSGRRGRRRRRRQETDKGEPTSHNPQTFTVCFFIFCNYRSAFIIHD